MIVIEEKYLFSLIEDSAKAASPSNTNKLKVV